MIWINLFGVLIAVVSGGLLLIAFLLLLGNDVEIP